MNRLICVLSLLILAAACENRGERIITPAPVQPSVPISPAPPPPVTPVTPRSIAVGEEVKDTFKGNALEFELTAPRDGVLVATVTWDVWFNGSILVLSMGGVDVKPAPPWSPITGKMQVVAGQTYRLSIKPGGTDWFYGDPFILQTWIE